MKENPSIKFLRENTLIEIKSKEKKISSFFVIKKIKNNIITLDKDLNQEENKFFDEMTIKLPNHIYNTDILFNVGSDQFKLNNSYQTIFGDNLDENRTEIMSGFNYREQILKALVKTWAHSVTNIIKKKSFGFLDANQWFSRAIQNQIQKISKMFWMCCQAVAPAASWKKKSFGS